MKFIEENYKLSNNNFVKEKLVEYLADIEIAQWKSISEINKDRLLYNLEWNKCADYQIKLMNNWINHYHNKLFTPFKLLIEVIILKVY